MSLVTIIIINFNFSLSTSAEDEIPKPTIGPKDVTISAIDTNNELNK